MRSTSNERLRKTKVLKQKKGKKLVNKNKRKKEISYKLYLEKWIFVDDMEAIF